MNCNHKTAMTGLLIVLVLFAGSAGAETKLDDATIFAIFDQANVVDIWTGRLGLKQGHTEEVRALARMVATDHEAVQQLGRDLAKKLGVSKPVITRALDSMGKLELVTRRRDEKDRRNVLIQRTVKGALYLERLADTIGNLSRNI